jgi:hypothetical protein
MLRDMLYPPFRDKHLCLAASIDLIDSFDDFRNLRFFHLFTTQFMTLSNYAYVTGKSEYTHAVPLAFFMLWEDFSRFLFFCGQFYDTDRTFSAKDLMSATYNTPPENLEKLEKFGSEPEDLAA